MNIEEDVTCMHCNGIYKDPVYLNCCENVICKVHIDAALTSVKQTSEKAGCPLCNSEIRNQKFQIIKPLKKLIEKRELHKLKILEDPKFEDTLQSLKDKIKCMKMVENDPDAIIRENISEIKRQVYLDRGKLKKKIDELSEIIKKLDSFEIEFKEDSKTKVKEIFNKNFKKSLNDQLEEYEKTLNSLAKTNEEREKNRLLIEDVLKILELKMKKLKNQLFSNKTIEYASIPKNIEHFLFGKSLVVNENLKNKEYDEELIKLSNKNLVSNTVSISILIVT